MNRIEFMKRLEVLLQSISEEERKDALCYYEDYFEDAGPQRERDVIRELISPEHVARTILEELNAGPLRQDESRNNTINGQQQQNYNQHNTVNAPYGQVPSGSRPDSQKSEWNTIAIVLLLVTLPITVPVVLSVISTVISVFFGVLVSILAFFIAGALLLTYGVVMAAAGNAAWSILCFGIGMILFALAFILIPFVIWICATAIPAVYRFIRDNVKKFIMKGGRII